MFENVCPLIHTMFRHTHTINWFTVPISNATWILSDPKKSIRCCLVVLATLLLYYQYCTASHCTLIIIIIIILAGWLFAVTFHTHKRAHTERTTNEKANRLKTLNLSVYWWNWINVRTEQKKITNTTTTMKTEEKCRRRCASQNPGTI